MTIANILAADKAAYMVSDGGVTDLKTGNLVDISDKVCAVPSANTAFAAVGGAWITEFVGQFVEQQSYTCYDDLVSGMRDNIQEVILGVYRQVDGAPQFWDEFSIAMIGWDTRARADILHVISKPNAKFECNTIPSAVFPATIPCRSRLDPTNIEISAVTMADEQRQVVSPGDPVVVTGFVQLTTVSADGIHKKVLKHYPDEVGKPAVR